MLTVMFDEVAERGRRETPRGMAHWAGTGPAGMRCADCAHFSNKTKTKGRCSKFAKLMRKHGPEFSGRTPACKYFAK